MAEEKEKPKIVHVGTKTLALLLGLLLSFIYAIMKFFSADFNLTLADLSNIGLVTAFFCLVFTAIFFFAQILWTYAHKLGETLWA